MHVFNEFVVAWKESGGNSSNHVNSQLQSHSIQFASTSDQMHFPAVQRYYRQYQEDRRNIGIRSTCTF